MKSVVLAVLLSAIAVSPCPAQQIGQSLGRSPGQSRSASDGKFCKDGSDTLASLAASGGGGRQFDLSVIYRNCEPGETILVPIGFEVFAALICDFTNAIGGTPRALVCVLGPQRR